jgi:chorismate mutase/prephenate dehydrogenase
MSLDDLRARIAEIDRQIVELVAERQRLGNEVGAVKRAEGRATRDFGREKQVIDAARARATQLGISGALAESLMQTLIRSSLATQERARVRAEGQGLGKPALVIGGAGKMGRWFAEFLDSQGYDVTVADPATSAQGFRTVPDWRQTSDEFAVTVVAAPLGITGRILSEMAELRRHGLIFDIGSLKSPLFESLRRLAASGAKIASVHPMFGPDTELLSGRHVLFMDVGSPEATREARQLFASTMARQMQMPLEEHDRVIGYVLGLSHALNIAFFTALAESGEAAPRLADLSSTTFDAQLEIAARVARESPHLYFEIQALNPFGLSALEGLQNALRTLIEIVRAADENGFVKLMEQGRAYLARRPESVA